MTGKNLILYELVKTFILILIRKRTLPLIALILSIPVAVSTACILVPYSLEEESSQLIKMLGEKESLIITPLPRNIKNKDNLSLVCIGNITVRNHVFEIPILYLKNNIFIRELKHWPHDKLSQYEGAIRVSISSFLKNKLNLTVGSEIHICTTDRCEKYIVNYIHENKGFYTFSIILIVSENNNLNLTIYECPYKLVKSNNSLWISSTLDQLTDFVSIFTYYFAIGIIFIYFPIVFLGYRKIISTIRDEISILYSIGVSNSYIKTALGIVLILLGAFMIVYGVCLGIFALHLSIWALRFAGIILSLRPILSIKSLCYIMIPYAAWVLLSVATLLRRGVENLE